MELEGNSNAVTSTAFLMQLRERCSGPLKVIWDNAPAHRGEAVRECLAAPGLGIQLVSLPGYSPDFNADEAIWGWVRRRLPETCAWGPRLWCGKGSAISSVGWPAGETKSNGAAGPSCNQGPRGYRETSGPIPKDLKMHIPPWL